MAEVLPELCDTERCRIHCHYGNSRDYREFHSIRWGAKIIFDPGHNLPEHAGVVCEILDADHGSMSDRFDALGQASHQLGVDHEHAWVDGRRESRQVQGGVRGGDGRQPHLPSFPLQFQRHGQTHFERTGGVGEKLFGPIADQHDAIHAWKCNVTCVSPAGFKVIN